MIKTYVFGKDRKLERNVACIGYFDGVHRGHQLLIKKAVEEANKKGVKPYLITFKPDPYEVITKKKAENINSFNKRLKLFEQFGIKGVIIIPFDEELMKMNKDEFYEKVLKKLNNETLVCGEDFTYAYKGQGKAKDLKKKQDVIIVESLNYYGKKISSTRIKKALKEGKISLANKMLGYEYQK